MSWKCKFQQLSLDHATITLCTGLFFQVILLNFPGFRWVRIDGLFLWVLAHLTLFRPGQNQRPLWQKSCRSDKNFLKPGCGSILQQSKLVCKTSVFMWPLYSVFVWLENVILCFDSATSQCLIMSVTSPWQNFPKIWSWLDRNKLAR